MENFDNIEFSTLKEVVIQLLQNTGYLVDLSTTGVATGFDKVDAITNGFQAGEVSAIASKPGNGRTAFLLSLLFNIASKSGKTVGVFSPERSATKMFYRLIESETHQSIKKIRERELKDSDREQVNTNLYNLSKAEIYVDDSSQLKGEELKKRCCLMRKKYGVDIIFIDSFELLCGGNTYLPTSMEEEMEVAILKDIKAVAKELDIPIVVLSHISNSAKLNLENNEPITNHVANHILENIDSVYFILRDYRSDIAKFIIAKHKNITEKQEIELKFIESIDKFVDK